MLLLTTSVTERSRGEEPCFPGRLEEIVGAFRDLPAPRIPGAIRTGLQDFTDPDDDITVVLIKKN